MGKLLAETSSIKVGWAVCWAAFWTGFPFKIIAALLLLAMQAPPWEGGGLTALLVVSIPIDIWALGLTARTYFLERHGLELEGPVGLSLWWQGAIIGGAFVAAAYFLIGESASLAKQLAASIIGVVKKVLPQFPIAEQITIELLLWTVPTIAVAVILALVTLKLYGWRIKAVAESTGRASGAPYEERVRRWDYSRIPNDPALMFAALSGVMVLLTLAFWSFLPVTTPHPAEDFKPQAKKSQKPVKPEDLIKQTEMSLAMAEAVLQGLEQGKEKGKGKEKKDVKKPEQKGK